MGHRHFNGLKTAMLFGLLGAIVIGASVLLFGRSWAALAIGLALSLVVNGVTWWRSASLALRAMRAHPVTEAEAPVMYRIVRELSQRAGQPMPSLHVSPTMAPNAFATGRDPAHAAVCCTEGILAILDERELRGVLGHELMHVHNRDVLTSSLAAAASSVITSLAYGAMFLGGGRERPHPLGSILILVLGPLAAGIVQLAISRTREYDADEDGSRLTGDPLALASALRTLDAGTKELPLRPERDLVNASHLFIADPFRPGQVSRFMSTHPPMADRVARLEAMAAGGAGG